MNDERIQKKIFAFRPVRRLLARVSSKVVPVLRLLTLLLEFFVSLLQLFNRGGSGLVVIPVLQLLILLLRLFNKDEC